MAEDGSTQNGKGDVDLRLCRRCHKYFDLNRQKKGDRGECVFHSKTWAVRYHPEGRRYYAAVEENPKFDGWPGACWECCGEENRDAPGCTVGPHVTYDE